jgi:beta-lactamase class D
MPVPIRRWLRTAVIVVVGFGGVSLRAAPQECFMLQALDGSARYASDGVECQVRTAPASTFKIPHSLLALDAGVVTNPRAPVKWDGSEQPFDSWERDHSLDSAVKNSVFWFYQRTARSIGRERMRDGLARLKYTGDTFDGDVASFWVNGDLVVSPAEQLAFLRRMMRYDLPFRRGHVDAVKETFRMPEGSITNASGTHPFALVWPAGTVVRAKTGNATVNGERVSWLIGHIESAGKQWVFVSRVRKNGALPGTAGAELALRMLNEKRPAGKGP